MSNPEVGALEQVALATMLPGGQQIAESTRNKVWKTHVALTDGTETVAFVKVVPSRDLFVECVCAALGRQLALPIPRPLIVKPTEEALKSAGLKAGTLAFGSEDAAHPSLHKFVQAESMLGLWQSVDSMGVPLKAGVFDEWIANGDRNIGNVLFSNENEFWLIDHGEAIPIWLGASDAIPCNHVVDQTVCKEDEHKRRRFLTQVESRTLPKYRFLSFGDLPEIVSGSKYMNEESMKEVIDFLESRTPEVVRDLLEARLKLDQGVLCYERNV